MKIYQVLGMFFIIFSLVGCIKTDEKFYNYHLVIPSRGLPPDVFCNRIENTECGFNAYDYEGNTEIRCAKNVDIINNGGWI